MKTDNPKRKYASTLRQDQALKTKDRIVRALLSLFRRIGNHEEITFKAVASQAGLPEITVYRHFPTRQDLLRALWENINREMGPSIGMPKDLNQLLAQNKKLHSGFEKASAHIIASLTTRQGREMRASLNSERQRAFLEIAREANPRMSLNHRRRIAALLQLLHSAYAWDSLKEQWGFSAREIGEITQFGLNILIQSAKNITEEKI